MSGEEVRRGSYEDAHDRLEELAVGHALGALEPEDEGRLQQHLPSCARCAAVVTETRGVMAELAHAVEPVEPPPALLEGIRAGVAASGRARVLPPPALPAATAGPTSTVRPLVRRARPAHVRRAVPRPTSRVLVAAALTGLLGLAGWNLSLRADVAQRADEVAALEAAVDGMRAPGAQVVRLTDPATGGVPAVALVRDGRVQLVVDGLKPNDPSATRYVLWRLAAYGPAVKVAEFDVRSADQVEVVSAGRLPQRGVEKLAITHEALPVPATGSTPVAAGVVGA